MSVFPRGAELLGASYGLQVVEPAKTIPATTFSNIFTVSGGRVLVTSLTGVVTTVIGAVATTLSVGVTPTGGSLAATGLCTATAITSLPVGAQVGIPPLISGALVVSAASGVLQAGSGSGTSAIGVPVINGGIAVVSPGVININTSATTTGALSWTLMYVPLDTGALVTAV
jgi:hypothetical protein